MRKLCATLFFSVAPWCAFAAQQLQEKWEFPGPGQMDDAERAMRRVLEPIISFHWAIQPGRRYGTQLRTVPGAMAIVSTASPRTKAAGSS